MLQTTGMVCRTTAILKKELAEILKQEVLETGGTVLMVSHDVNYCAEYADRCAMLFDGELLQGSTPEEFFGNPQNPRLKEFLSKVLV